MIHDEIVTYEAAKLAKEKKGDSARWVVSWPIGRPTRPIMVSEKFYSEDEAREFAEGVKQEMRKVGALLETEQVQVYKEEQNGNGETIHKG